MLIHNNKQQETEKKTVRLTMDAWEILMKNKLETGSPINFQVDKAVKKYGEKNESKC